ncbi:MAG TPA: TlpA disulfide reductase family protein [Bacteroidota bacterium]|nr:TlpA disulfide reductase family protein [Bacteroidota bacterium]
MNIRSGSAFLAAVLLLLSGCAKQQEHKEASATEVRADNVSEVVSVEKREAKVPNFTWKDASGNTVNFDAVRGKAALVNFWATWCGPCKKELPDLVALDADLAAKGFKVIGVSTDRGSNVIDDVRSFVKEHDIKYQVVVSTEDLEEAFGNVRLLPTSFIIDGQGKIVQTFVGPRSKEFFTEALLAASK